MCWAGIWESGKRLGLLPTPDLPDYNRRCPGREIVEVQRDGAMAIDTLIFDLGGVLVCNLTKRRQLTKLTMLKTSNRQEI